MPGIMKIPWSMVWLAPDLVAELDAGSKFFHSNTKLNTYVYSYKNALSEHRNKKTPSININPFVMFDSVLNMNNSLRNYMLNNWTDML